MHARLTATTVQAGSTVESLSELVRGSAAVSDSGRDSDSGDLDLGVPDLADDLDSAAGRESAYVDQQAVDFTGMFHAEVTSTAADRMVAVVSTPVADRTVEATGADTGKVQQ